MRAAYYDQQGDPLVLRLGELPDPMAGPGEVRVRIAVSGLNPSDTKGRSGWGGAPMPFPRIVPHQDGSGVIESVGPGVDPARIGERVWIYEAQRGRPFGTGAELCIVPAEQAVALPEGVSFEVGACLGVPAMTAHRCLLADGAIEERWVLVQGGTGAVGLAAVMLAKYLGARVIATVSREQQARVVSAAGCDLVLNRHADDIASHVREATDGHGVDRVIDVSLATNIATDLACLATNGVICAYASDSADTMLTVPFVPALLGGATIRWVFVYAMPHQAHLDAARDINAALASGACRPVIGLDLPLDEIARAHAAQDSGTVVGKILLRVG
ncbi:NADPH:quinone reductase [Sandaracinobacteroides saxicola]|uniref:NADPH:quinone reductase n=1 Tax=Sandaracinobacteroides saxicola TaxID=2759707 RepID=A0A7G5IIQ7_9SPHN|nr:NADPH:quinone reductase [Sandaracinobacteroides saxicola]QMW23249.1 NADPH:quinone reductase [Sandaracinobacteroides saxicola]